MNAGQMGGITSYGDIIVSVMDTGHVADNINFADEETRAGQVQCIQKSIVQIE